MTNHRFLVKKTLSLVLSFALLFSLVKILDINSTTNALENPPTIIGDTPEVTTCSTEDNIIPNGDCEDGTAFWDTFYGYGWGDSWPAIVTEESHSATHSLKLGGDDWAPSGAFANITLQANTNYTYSFWYKGINGGGATFVYKTMFDDTPVGGDRYYVLDGQWHQAAVEFNTGSATQFAMQNWLSSTDTTSYIYLDDACLFLTPEPSGDPIIISEDVSDATCLPEHNIIPNGDCEDGTAFYDTFHGYGWGDSWPAIVTEESHSATHSLKLGGDHWAPSGAFANITLQANTNYTYSFWYKGINGGGATFVHKLMFDDTPVGGDKYYNLDGNWHRGTYQFNTGSATQFAMHNWLKSNDTTSYIYLDDFYLFESVNAIPAPTETPEPTGDPTATPTVDPSFPTVYDAEPELRYCALENNLIENGGAENGTAFWDTIPYYGLDYPWPIITDEDSYTGDYSVKFGGDNWSPSGAFSPITIKANTEYIFSFWYKGVDGGAANFAYKFMFESIPVGGDRMYILDDEWHQMAVRFNSGPYTDFTMRNWLNSQDGNSYIYLDDMYLFESMYGIAEMSEETDSTITPEPDPTDESPSTSDPVGMMVILMASVLFVFIVLTKKRLHE